jgi:hypothetical protein
LCWLTFPQVNSSDYSSTARHPSVICCFTTTQCGDESDIGDIEFFPFIIATCCTVVVILIQFIIKFETIHIGTTRSTAIRAVSAILQIFVISGIFLALFRQSFALCPIMPQLWHLISTDR